uniref:Uncharacterized protein n=1 Tax=Romanomermis culicivorax TaxID=13658 RepID=A0A915IFM4_ROMCU
MLIDGTQSKCIFKLISKSTHFLGRTSVSIKIGSHTNRDLVLKIKSSGTEVASSSTELHPVEPILSRYG